jgi:3-hydroxyacyl-[acyl-carrier-protein] dehydratase
MLTPDEVLELMPQKPPFRYLERLLELSATSAVGEYTFRRSEWFYAGHFPGDPMTPGVILIETMCQTGLVALGIYLLGLTAPRVEVERSLTLFSDCDVEFSRPVRPGETVRVVAERLTWRRMKLRSRVRLFASDGQVAAQGIVGGVGRMRPGGRA